MSYNKTIFRFLGPSSIRLFLIWWRCDSDWYDQRKVDSIRCKHKGNLWTTSGWNWTNTDCEIFAKREVTGIGIPRQYNIYVPSIGQIPQTEPLGKVHGKLAFKNLKLYLSYNCLQLPAKTFIYYLLWLLVQWKCKYIMRQKEYCLGY